MTTRLTACRCMPYWATIPIAGAVCGLIGTYVVLRSMSYIGHGLSHAIFGGFAASSLLGGASKIAGAMA